MDFLHIIGYGDNSKVMVTCLVGYLVHTKGYSVVEEDSCKTVLSWVDIGRVLFGRVVSRRVGLILSVRG